jgi:hypothetical protein
VIFVHSGVSDGRMAEIGATGSFLSRSTVAGGSFRHSIAERREALAGGFAP